MRLSRRLTSPDRSQWFEEMRNELRIRLIARLLRPFYGRSIRGFWVFNWLRDPANLDKLTAIFYTQLAPMVVFGEISTPVAGVVALEDHLKALIVAANFSGKASLHPALIDGLAAHRRTCSLADVICCSTPSRSASC